MNVGAGHSSGAARAALVGAGAGVIGSVVMGGYAMVAGATYQGSGLFTPLYHIAAVITAPVAVITSMQLAGRGDSFYFAAGPAAVGLVVHMVTGAAYGVVFGLLVWWLRLTKALTVALGTVYGVAVLLVSSFVGLPIAARVFGGGEPISGMPRLAGWGTFTVEHLIFGLVAGGVVALTAVARRAGEPVGDRAASGSRPTIQRNG